ncbi:MAG: hypothetical protein ACLVME_07420 [Ezakiella coagulans]|uniref:hypothetical protein n=1 Tax=Ezakiella coagulans TaxID=46507 RepID=UPI00288AD628|nr:hypothetical protein [Ezakiella coagulans]
MAYRVISGFQDLETKVFYNIHETIDEKNKNLEKYLKAGVVIDDGEKTATKNTKVETKKEVKK